MTTLEPAPPEEDEVLTKLLARIAPVHVQSKYTKVLLYGDIGVGKTYWAARAPKPLLIAIERGSKTLLNHTDTSNVDVMEFVSVGQIEALAQKIREGKLPYETYILDTFSELQRVVLDNRLVEVASRVQGKDKFVPEGKDYQYNNERMRQIAALWRDVPANVIFTSHEKEPDDNVPAWRPDLAPKVTKTIGGYADIIGRLTSETGEDGTYSSKLNIRPSRRQLGKTRIKTLPPILINSSFMDIHEANMAQIRSAENV